MNNKTIIRIIVVAMVIVTNFTYTALTSLKPPPLPPRRQSAEHFVHKSTNAPNIDVFVKSKDPDTNIQIQYATGEYNATLARYYTFTTTIQLKDRPNGALCAIKQHSEQNPILSFYESSINKKILTINALEDDDEFTIHRENNSILITKKNKFKKSKKIEMARFTLKPQS